MTREPTTAYAHYVGETFQLYAFIAPYKVVGRAAGAFGAVYFLKDRLGVMTAAKSPRADLPQLADSAFADEATLWASLSPHHSVLRAHRVIAYEDRPYVHMDYVPHMRDCGASLADVLTFKAGHPLNANVILTVVYHLAGALRHIEIQHEGFVHGDVKPQNLLVMCYERASTAAEMLDMLYTGEAGVLLSDFGMSRAASALPTVARFGDSRYLAPEILVPLLGQLPTSQFYAATDGHVAAPDKLTDMYAVGCTLFEMLTGMPYQVVDATRGAVGWCLGPNSPTVALLRELRPDVPAGLAEIVAACLARDRHDRPASYEHLGDLVQHLMAEAGSIEKELDVPYQTVPDGFHPEESAPVVRYARETLGMTGDAAREWNAANDRAVDLRSVGRLDASDNVLDQLIAQHPTYAPALGSKAVNSMRRVEKGATDAADVQEAILSLRTAIAAYESDPKMREIDPAGYAGACMNLAKILAFPLNDVYAPEALNLARVAVGLLPASSKAEESRGAALLRQQEFLEAGQAFLRAQELDPSSRRPVLFRVVACELAAAAGYGDHAQPDVLAASLVLTSTERQSVADTCAAWSAVFIRDSRSRDITRAQDADRRPGREGVDWAELAIRFAHARLGPGVQRSLTLLAPFTTVIPLFALEHYADLLSQHPAVAALGELDLKAAVDQAVSVGLAHMDPVNPNHAALQPRFPHLLRIRANEQPDLQRALKQAHQDLYQHIGHELLALLASQIPEEHATGTALIGAEYTNLRTALSHAIDHDGPLLALVMTVDAYLELKQQHAARAQVLEQVLAAVQEPFSSTRADERGELLHLAGDVALTQRRYPAAKEHYEAELALLLEGKDRRYAAEPYSQLGKIARHQRRFEEADNHYQRALELFLESDDRQNAAITLQHLGLVAQQRGDLADAEQHYQRALEFLLELDNHGGVASIYHYLGMLAVQQGRFPAAEQHYRRSLELKLALDDRAGVANAYHQLGMLEQERRRFPAAEQHYQRALELESDDRHGAASTYHQLGMLAQEQRRSTTMTAPPSPTASLGCC